MAASANAGVRKSPATVIRHGDRTPLSCPTRCIRLTARAARTAIRANSATTRSGQHGDGQEDGQADGVGEEVEAVAEMRLPDLRGEMGTGPGGPRKDDVVLDGEVVTGIRVECPEPSDRDGADQVVGFVTGDDGAVTADELEHRDPLSAEQQERAEDEDSVAGYRLSGPPRIPLLPQRGTRG